VPRGIDLHHAVYDWDYARQLLALRAAEGGIDEGELLSPRFLLRRPLLDALESEEAVVLLIDEVDRSDDEFEAFLLEFLSDFAVTIPELGTVRCRPAAGGRADVEPDPRAARRAQAALPVHWIDYPSPGRERAIVEARIPASRTRSPSASCRPWAGCASMATCTSCPGSARRWSGLGR